MNEKAVDFSYCETCKFKNLEDSEYPCYICLGVSYRKDSNVPKNYKHE